MMQHIKQINILDMMKMYGEDSCKAVLSTFMCPLNLDVEDFIQNKAVPPLSGIIPLPTNLYQ